MVRSKQTYIVGEHTQAPQIVYMEASTLEVFQQERALPDYEDRPINPINYHLLNILRESDPGLIHVHMV